MDKSYWWHNLLLLDGARQRFHYPFKKEYGDVVDYVYQRVRNWLGTRVVEFGCGTGWLREAWHIDVYTGVERNGFHHEFEDNARARAIHNRVVTMGVEDFVVSSRDEFDTIVCYESFHEFPFEALAAARSTLLAPGGTLIAIDAKKWWPEDLVLGGDGMEILLDEEIPCGLFDVTGIACISLDLIERLEQNGHSRAEVMDAAEYNVQPEVYHPLDRGVDLQTLRKELNSAGLVPPADLEYSIVVLRKAIEA